jgi:hypothetical protein
MPGSEVAPKKMKVQELLQKFDLDEGMIDAEAYRSVSSELQELDKSLIAAQARFAKTLREISEYRKVRESFALAVTASADEILKSEDCPLLELEPLSETSVE